MSISLKIILKEGNYRLYLPPGAHTLRIQVLDTKAIQLHDVRVSIPLYFPPRVIDRDLILSEIPQVKE